MIVQRYNKIVGGGVLINLRILQFSMAAGVWWFRVFGYGLLFKDTRRNRLLFSERYGYHRIFRIPRSSWIVRGLC